MKLIVKPHKIEIEKTPVNEKEIDVTKVEFEFADEITNEYVKEAYFTLNSSTYKKIIVNNECNIPYEVLTQQGQVEIGVVAYLVEDEEEIKRYNPSPVYIATWKGSLKDNADNSEPITPSEMEQYEQALQDGLETVNNKIELINDALIEVENQDIDAEKVNTTTTVTITKKDGTQQTVTILDGEKGETGASGKDGKDGRDGANGRDGYIQYDSYNKLNADYVDDSESTNKFTSATEKMVWNNKQDTLVSGINIKTINDQSILGEGNITIEGGGGSGTSNYNDLTNKPSINNITLTGNKSLNDLSIQRVIDSSHKLSSDLVDDTNKTNKFVTASEKTTWSGKQDALVSGTNIKTINNESILGSGNISISGGGTATDVQINGTSIVSNNTANILTNTAYNSSSNKIATMSDIPDITGKQDKIPVETSSQTTITIDPNKYYSFGEAASLNITLATPSDNTIYNEYMFEFDSGSTATTLTLPNTVEWVQTPTIEASKTYQVSIVNNIGIIVGV